MLILFLSLSNTTCATLTRLLTNSTNNHSSEIYILKMSDDYRTVFSVDNNGAIKIWDFNIPRLDLRQ